MPALIRIRPDLDERKFAVNRTFPVQNPDIPHIDELGDLLLDLIENVIITMRHNCDASDLRISRHTGSDTVDVVAASGKKSRNAAQNTKLIVDKELKYYFLFFCFLLFCHP